jgi:molybdate transport system permease protein
MTDPLSESTPLPLVPRRRSDLPFFLVMSGLSSCFILLIVLLLAADLLFTSLSDFKAALLKPEIQSAFWLTMLSCSATAILSIWVATPLGYLLSLHH